MNMILTSSFYITIFGKILCRSQVKVKEWEETREEQKRRILEGPGSS